jgi:hypothetical protein
MRVKVCANLPPDNGMVVRRQVAQNAFIVPQAFLIREIFVLSAHPVVLHVFPKTTVLIA